MAVRTSISVALFLGTVLCGCTSQRSSSGLESQDALSSSLRSAQGFSRISDGNGYKSGQYDRAIGATGPGWRLTVHWKMGHLERQVSWQKGDAADELIIGLRHRPRPWTTTLDGITMTSYGPYQPALDHVSTAGHWAVGMCHEKLDFKDQSALKRFLGWNWYADPMSVAFDPSGLLVCLHVSLKGGKIHGNSLSIEIYEITLQGRPLDPDVFRPLAKGSIQCR